MTDDNSLLYVPISINNRLSSQLMNQTIFFNRRLKSPTDPTCVAGAVAAHPSSGNILTIMDERWKTSQHFTELLKNIYNRTTMKNYVNFIICHSFV